MTMLLLSGIAVLALAAFGQDLAAPARPPAAELVQSVRGISILLEQEEERYQSGNSAVEVTNSKVYRDSSGRVRIDTNSQHNPHQPPTSVPVDPNSGLRVVLLNDTKTAYRIAGPRAGENGFALGRSGIGDALPPGNWHTTTEPLGKRIIEGIEFEGTRIIQSLEGKPGLTNTIDRWYSEQLNLVGLAVASGPYGTHTARIRNLQRQEPDPTVFTIPVAYKVVDVALATADQR